MFSQQPRQFSGGKLDSSPLLQLQNSINNILTTQKVQQQKMEKNNKKNLQNQGN
jgi:hypothetical protein